MSLHGVMILICRFRHTKAVYEALYCSYTNIFFIGSNPNKSKKKNQETTLIIFFLQGLAQKSVQAAGNRGMSSRCGRLVDSESLSSMTGYPCGEVTFWNKVSEREWHEKGAHCSNKWLSSLEING